MFKKSISLAYLLLQGSQFVMGASAAAPALDLLQQAVATGDLVAIMAQSLRDSEVDLNQKDEDGDTPLHRAVENNNELAVRALIRAGADLSNIEIESFEGHEKMTDILSAAMHSNERAVNSSDLDVDDYDELREVVAHRNLVPIMAQSLLDAEINVNEVDICGRAALHRAVENSNKRAIKALLAAGAYIDIPDDKGWTPLTIAVSEDNEEIVRFLVEHKADVNKAADNGATPLHFAVYNGYENIVKFLVEHEADVNAGDEDGETPLHLVAKNGYENIVKFLVEHEADVNKTADDGATPLHVAAENGYENIVTTLINAGADVNRSFNNGATSLYIAAQNGYEEIIRILIAAHADVNKAFADGVTPLYIAAEKGYEEIIRILIAAGADVNKAGAADGVTPLYIAVENGYENIVKTLIDSGAEIDLIANDGFKPLDICTPEVSPIFKDIIIQRARAFTENSEKEQCSICLDTYRSQSLPVVLHKNLDAAGIVIEPGHRVCKNCLPGLLAVGAQNFIVCPICRQIVQKRSLQKVLDWLDEEVPQQPAAAADDGSEPRAKRTALGE